MQKVNLMRQRGFGMFYIFLVVLLLGLLASAFMRTPSASLVVQIDGNANNISAQANLIRSRIIKCSIDYPAGDNATTYHTQYPGATTWTTDLSGLICPGMPAPNNLWNGTVGIFLPIAPANMGNWQYINDATSVRLKIQALNASGITALGKAATRFGSGEAALSTTTLTNDTLTLILQL